jgi:hypothetical protein
MTATAQQMNALARGNRTRFARAAVRRKIRNAEIGMLEALREPCCATATIYSMLIAQRQWGNLTTMRFLNQIGGMLGGPLFASRQVSDLTERQVQAIVLALGERAA